MAPASAVHTLTLRMPAPLRLNARVVARALSEKLHINAVAIVYGVVFQPALAACAAHVGLGIATQQAIVLAVGLARQAEGKGWCSLAKAI